MQCMSKKIQAKKKIEEKIIPSEIRWVGYIIHSIFVAVKYHKNNSNNGDSLVDCLSASISRLDYRILGGDFSPS